SVVLGASSPSAARGRLGSRRVLRLASAGEVVVLVVEVAEVVELGLDVDLTAAEGLAVPDELDGVDPEGDALVAGDVEREGVERRSDVRARVEQLRGLGPGDLLAATVHEDRRAGLLRGDVEEVVRGRPRAGLGIHLLVAVAEGVRPVLRDRALEGRA